MLAKKINKITNRQVAIIFAALGLVVFFTGLSSPFQGDDFTQIVNNIPVHSISHIRLFFEGGTQYAGNGLTPLSGIYYRPLLSTVYSLLYSLFGAHTIAFHLFQLALYISSAFLLYLIFKFSFKTPLSLFLALIFLVHPLNSQVAFSISSMQEVLFFFFGILGMWLLLSKSTNKGLITVVACFLLSLLSKETAIVFVLVAAVYLFWFNRERLTRFIYYMAGPLAIYLVLKLNALGIHGRSHVGPIDNLNVYGRLLDMPSIFLFYITKFIFPWKLATGYYWTHPSFSVSYFLLPLVIDIAIIGAFVYLGLKINKKLKKTQFYTYLFFAIWAAIGMLPNLQIIPLGLTVSESWFYFTMAGLLGMLGVIYLAYPIRHFKGVKREWIIVLCIVLIGALGVRTAVRGHDWDNIIGLAYKDAAASPSDYSADNIVASSLIVQGKYNESQTYTMKSINTYPEFYNYYTLGVSSGFLGNYSAASKAYTKSLTYSSDNELVFDNLGELTLVHGTASGDYLFLTGALKIYPKDSTLWMYLSILEYRLGFPTTAKAAITNAIKTGEVPQFIYNGIVNQKHFTITLTDLNTKVKVQ